MTPDRLSRRDALRLSSVAFLGLAGCSTQASDADERDTSTPSPTASEQEYQHSVNAPASSTVRNPEGKPAVHSSAHSPEENLFESSASWNYEDWIVTAPPERDALNFSQTTTGVKAATDFIADTNLSEETLLVHQYNISTCETRQLDRIEWSTESKCGDVTCVGIHLSYEQTKRESDCQDDETTGSDSPPYSADSYDSEALFVRVPGQIQSYGSFSFQA